MYEQVENYLRWLFDTVGSEIRTYGNFKSLSHYLRVDKRCLKNFSQGISFYYFILSNLKIDKI